MRYTLFLGLLCLLYGCNQQVEQVRVTTSPSPTPLATRQPSPTATRTPASTPQVDEDKETRIQVKRLVSRGKHEEAWLILKELKTTNSDLLGERFRLGRKFETPGPDTSTYDSAQRLVKNDTRDREDRAAAQYLESVQLGLHKSPETCLSGLVDAAQKADKWEELKPFLVKTTKPATFFLESLKGTKVKVISKAENGDRATLKLELTIVDSSTKLPKSGRGVATLLREEGFWRLDPVTSSFGFGLRKLARSDYQINGDRINGVVKLGEGIGRVTSRLGEPTRIVRNQDFRSLQEYIYSDLGFALGVKTGVVEEIVILSPAIRTAEGLGIGDSLGDFQDTYGFKKPKGDIFFPRHSMYESQRGPKLAELNSPVNEFYGKRKHRWSVRLQSLDLNGFEHLERSSNIDYLSMGMMVP